MKTILIIFIIFFVWTLWDFLVVGKQEAQRREENDKKFKVKPRDNKR